MQTSKPVIVLGLSMLALIGGIFVLVLVPKGDVPVKNTASVLTTLDITGLSQDKLPWSAFAPELKARLDKLGMPALKEEGTVLHTHQHLDIFVNGENVPIPAEIGVGEGYIAPLHTHDGSGVIHIESPTVETFTLGQFFSVWGLFLAKDCLGGYCADDNNSLKFYLNGEEYLDDPTKLVLDKYQEIAIVYGPKDDTSVNVPKSYEFGPNL